MFYETFVREKPGGLEIGMNLFPFHGVRVQRRIQKKCSSWLQELTRKVKNIF